MSRVTKARQVRTHVVWLVFGCLSGAGCVLALAFALRLRDLQTAANLAQLLSIGLALVPVLVQLISWWRQGRRTGVITRDDIVGAREQLAQLLLEQWRTESRVRALDDPDPIPVRWRLTEHEELMDVPGNRTAGVLTVASSADVAALIKEFRQLRRRRLIILGDAGTGKTTLAVQILLQLLGERDERPDDPVPVLLPMAGWRSGAYDRDLRDWITDRIVTDYPDLATAGYGPHVVDALVSQGHILPILDGLDEAAPEVRETFIRAVHQSMDGSTELILTSPYGAIAALAEVASNPLGLWLIRAAYISPATDPARLLDDKQFTTGTALRAHLFDRLVAASISARPPSSDPAQLFRPRHEYGPEEVEAWLRFLAQNLDRWKRRDYDWARDTAALAAPFPWTVPVADFLRRTVPVLREPPRPVRRKPRQYSICGTDGGTGVTLRLGLAVACGDSVRPVGDQRLRDVWPNGRRAS